MNRRVLVLVAAIAVLGLVAWLTRGGDGSKSAAPARPGFRTTRAGASPAPGAANARSGYDNFKLVHTRNIFDPDRRPVRTGPAPAGTPSPTRQDYVALTGTFFDGEKKQLAFFTGTRPEYNKVLTVRDQIAGATIDKITGIDVQVTRNGRAVTVGVGQTVPLDATSAPAAAPAPTPQPTAAPAAAATPAPNAPAPASVGAAANPTGGVDGVPGGAAPGAIPASPTPPASSNLDEVRRRMEERRRQEQK